MSFLRNRGLCVMKDFDRFIDLLSDDDDRETVDMARASEFSSELDLGRDLAESERVVNLCYCQTIHLLRRYHEWASS